MDLLDVYTLTCVVAFAHFAARALSQGMTESLGMTERAA